MTVTTQTGDTRAEIERRMIERALSPVRCQRCGMPMVEVGRNEITGWRRIECRQCAAWQELSAG